MAELEQLQLLTIADAADALNVSAVTLWRWRNADPPKGPRAIRLGGRIGYDRSEIERWQREGDAR